MVQPASVINTASQSTDTIYGTDGVGRVKLAVGDLDASLTPRAAWAGVATHTDTDAFNSSDGIVVVGGVDAGVATKLLVDSLGRAVVSLSPSASSLTDKSGTITLGGTSQDLADVNVLRKYLFVQNVDTTQDLWINFTSAATVDKPSMKLGPGDSFVMEGSFVSSEKVTIIAATTAHKFTAKEG